MMAGLLRLALLAAAGVAVAGAFWLPSGWAPLFVLMVPATLVSTLAVVLALEFTVAQAVSDAPQGLRLLLAAWWQELLATCRLIAWRMPFLSGQAGHAVMKPAPGTPGTRGLVLVHGYGCNRGIWSAWLTQLQQQRVPYVAVNLEPIFASITDYQPIIEAAVLALQRQTGMPPVLVAHSMGGLVARAWWARDATAQRLHRLVTIGTPHQGTLMAKFGCGPNARQMRPQSDWLAGLTAQETAAHRRRALCFYSACDNMVMPSATATWPGADNREIIGAGHVALVDHPDIYAAVMRCASDSN